MEPARPAGDEELELDVGEVAQGGWCVAREPGGRVVLVRHALPGERVLARVTEVTSRFARAEATQILQASPDRVEPPCPHARPGGCGGCDWQHASLAAQRQFKASVISQQLRRIAGLDREITVEPLPGDEDGLGWRTRVRFAVRPGGLAGLRRRQVPRDHRHRDLPDRASAGQSGGGHPGALAGRDVGRSSDVTEYRRAGRGGDPGGGAAPAGRPGPGRGPAACPQPLSGVHSGLDGAGDRPGAGRRGERRADRAARRPGSTGPPPAGPGGPARACSGRSTRPQAGVLAGVVSEVLAPQPGDVALDLYCGAGLFAGTLAAAVGPSGEVIGIDPTGPPSAMPGTTSGTPPGPGSTGAMSPRSSARPSGTRPAWPCSTRPGSAWPARRWTSCCARAARCAGWPTCPATRPRWPVTSPCSPRPGWQLGALRAFDAFPMTHHVESWPPAARRNRHRRRGR